jgi:CubicO group peptidase (beta-lactamase class C family)
MWKSIVKASMLFAIIISAGGCGSIPTESTQLPPANPTSAPTATIASPTATPVPTPTAGSIETIRAHSQRLSGGNDTLIFSLAFSPNGELLASTGDDNTIRLWDVTSGQQKQAWPGGSASMTGLMFSPDGQFLASAEQDGTIGLWDVSSGLLVQRIGQAGLSVCGVAFSPDGSLLASGHPDGVVRLWEAMSGSVVKVLHGLEALSCPVTFSSDGRWIASGGGERDIRVVVWEVASSKLLYSLSGHTKYVYQVTFSPDGHFLASASGDRTIRLWHTDDGQLEYVLTADREKLSDVDFSPDSKFMISGGIDGSVRVWDAINGQCLALLPGHSGEIYAVAFSPVGQLFASAGSNGEVLLWSLTSPESSELPAYLEEFGASDQLSGAVLVAKDSTLLLEKAYGLGNRASLIPNQVDTKFNLGSMNKMFTAVAIFQLMEQGKLALDDPIIKHLPDYPNSEVARAVTVQHLLTHTSGLGDVFTEVFVNDIPHYRSNADYLPLFVNEPLQFKPGEQFSYSNAGYVVLGLIIERISGLSYDDYIQQNILDPAEMTNTGNFESNANTPGMAVGYTTKDFYGNETGILQENSSLMPVNGFAAGGGYSTVGDLLRFRDALLNFQLLNQQSTELLLKKQVTTRENSGYTYGFMDRIVAGQHVIGHTGGAPGICSFLYMYPESGYTVVVLSNSDNGCVLVLDFLKDNALK